MSFLRSLERFELDELEELEELEEDLDKLELDDELGERERLRFCFPDILMILHHNNNYEILFLYFQNIGSIHLSLCIFVKFSITLNRK